MGTGDKMLGGNLRWTSIPSRGSSNTPSRLHAKETDISSGSVGQSGLSAAFVGLTNTVIHVDILLDASNEQNSRAFYMLNHRIRDLFFACFIFFVF